jgi:hypothetical protein
MDMKENSKYAVFSVMGPHAGEDSDNIFKRKANDIISSKVGQTFWYVRSRRLNPNVVQNLCAEAIKQNCYPYCLFLLSRGAMQTKTRAEAKEYSSDLINWQPLPKDLGPVTGIMDRGAYALIFDELIVQKPEKIELGDYVFFDSPQSQIKTEHFASTVCGIRRDMSNNPERESNEREVIAKGRLVSPYAVWLR